MTALLTLERIYNDGNATLGIMTLNGVFQCFTLEDEPRHIKVAGETRIGAEKYVIRLRSEGGMHERYKNRFPKIHDGMLWLQHVPNFEWIYIHVGNTEDHTAGCILVGETATAYPSITVGRSVSAYKSLYRKVRDAAKSELHEDGLMIEIVDRDILTPEGDGDEEI